MTVLGHGCAGLSGALLIVLAVFVIPLIFSILIEYIVKQISVICPCSPMYPSWKEPTSSIPLYQTFYFLEIQNPDDVLRGATPIMKEKGPYVYNLTMKRDADSWNINNTVTYTQPIWYKFVRNMSVTSEDEVITTINFPFVAAVNSIKYKGTLVQVSVAAIAEATGAKLFKQLTVKEILWGYYDPFLHAAQKFAGKALIPDDHFGFLMGRNGTSNGLFTAFTGAGNISRRAHIEYWNGTNTLDWWFSKWANMINGTDGTMFHPFIDKSETLYMFNPDTCRSFPYIYKEDSSYMDVPLLHYYLPPYAYANTTVYPPNEEFCQSNCKFSGVFNISRAARGAPLGLSNPHFMNGSKELQESVIGLKPNLSLHENHFHVEPVMGLPYLFAERLQINLFVESLPDVPQTGKVKPFYYPFTWFEEKVTVRTEDAMEFKNTVLYMDKITHWLKIGLSILGCVMIAIPLLLVTRKQYRYFGERNSSSSEKQSERSYPDVQVDGEDRSVVSSATSITESSPLLA